MNNSQPQKYTKQRNPYLKRIASSSPHHYSYDINQGKYYLNSQDGTQQEINKIGTFKPKYKHYFSGFANQKERYNQSVHEPAHMHYIPDFKIDKNQVYYTPMLDKFAGYAQFPYKMKNSQFPEHLNKHTQKMSQSQKNRLILNTKNTIMRKSQSQNKKQLKSTKNNVQSVILQHSKTFFDNPEEKDKYFNLSFTSMTQSKPLPRKSKRTCYNYKCKYLKQFVFDEKSKLEQSTKYSTDESRMFERTLGKSFYDTSLRLQGQQNKHIDHFS